MLLRRKIEPKAGRFWDLEMVVRLVITVFTTSSVPAVIVNMDENRYKQLTHEMFDYNRLVA